MPPPRAQARRRHQSFGKVALNLARDGVNVRARWGMLARNNDESNTGKLTFEAGNPIAEICKRLPKWRTRRFFMLRNELYSLPSKANRRGMFCYLVKPFAICITVCQQDCLCNFSRFNFLNQLINEL